ncbi:hypothetical protein B9G53_13725 [Pseudanabaena sp. SR411]|nr:hypothetical protein B9G53_13725 [Pseudanabaena sp. SR411]
MVNGFRHLYSIKRSLQSNKNQKPESMQSAVSGLATIIQLQLYGDRFLYSAVCFLEKPEKFLKSLQSKLFKNFSGLHKT